MRGWLVGHNGKIMFYPAQIRKSEGSFLVGFRDIPEALTFGSTMEEAIKMAEDALLTAMDFYFEDQRWVPEPSKARRGEVLIPLAASVSAKVLLLNQMIDSGVTAAELARKLGTSPQTVNRIVNLKHATKIDTIAEALAALGKTLTISVA